MDCCYDNLMWRRRWHPWQLSASSNCQCMKIRILRNNYEIMKIDYDQNRLWPSHFAASKMKPHSATNSILWEYDNDNCRVVSCTEQKTHFTKVLRAHDPNLVKFMWLSLQNNDQTRSQFCTCHDSWAVVTCANLWPGWIVRIEIRT